MPDSSHGWVAMLVGPAPPNVEHKPTCYALCLVLYQFATKHPGFNESAENEIKEVLQLQQLVPNAYLSYKLVLGLDHHLQCGNSLLLNEGIFIKFNRELAVGVMHIPTLLSVQFKVSSSTTIGQVDLKFTINLYWFVALGGFPSLLLVFTPSFEASKSRSCDQDHITNFFTSSRRLPALDVRATSSSSLPPKSDLMPPGIALSTPLNAIHSPDDALRLIIGDYTMIDSTIDSPSDVYED
eukprot:Gb_13058 [translate_table: standard]